MRRDIDHRCEEPDHEENAHDKCKHNSQLGRRCSLDRLSRLNITYFARTILRFITIGQPIDLTRQADSKYRFKKQKNQAQETDYTRKQAVCIDHNQQGKHGAGQNNTDYAPDYSQSYDQQSMTEKISG